MVGTSETCGRTASAASSETPCRNHGGVAGCLSQLSTDHEELKEYPGARRILKSLDVIEACAVIRGAGVGTGTDSAKRVLVQLSDVGITPSFLMQTARTLRDTEAGRGLVRLEDLLPSRRGPDDGQSRLVRIN